MLLKKVNYFVTCLLNYLRLPITLIGLISGDRLFNIFKWNITPL